MSEPKLHALTCRVPMHGSQGPMPWHILPAGVELAQMPELSCDASGASLRLVVRCDVELGKRLLFIPFDRPAAAPGGPKP